MITNPTIEYLDWLEQQIKENRALVVATRNQCNDAIEHSNRLRLSIQQRRIALLQDELKVKQ